MTDKINREIFVFYQKDGKLHQVALSEYEVGIIAETLVSLHNGAIKVMSDEFCGIQMK